VKRLSEGNYYWETTVWTSPMGTPCNAHHGTKDVSLSDNQELGCTHEQLTKAARARFVPPHHTGGNFGSLRAPREQFYSGGAAKHSGICHWEPPHFLRAHPKILWFNPLKMSTKPTANENNVRFSIATHEGNQFWEPPETPSFAHKQTNRRAPYTSRRGDTAPRV